MKDRKAPRKEPEQLDPESEAWSKVPWRKLERHTFRIQKRIFQASQRGNQRAVQKLQKLLMKSQAARLVATRRVTQDNQGKRRQEWMASNLFHPNNDLLWLNKFTRNNGQIINPIQYGVSGYRSLERRSNVPWGFPRC